MIARGQFGGSRPGSGIISLIMPCVPLASPLVGHKLVVIITLRSIPYSRAVSTQQSYFVSKVLSNSKSLAFVKKTSLHSINLLLFASLTSLLK